MADRADILFISKPLQEPFDDSGKVLPYLIATRVTSHRFYVPVTGDEGPGVPQVSNVKIPVSSGSYKANLNYKVMLFFKALGHPAANVLHFFFSPNPMGNMFGKVLKRLKGLPAIQTIMSLPMRPEDLNNALFGDWVVVWSKMGEEWVRQAAQASKRDVRVVHIRPGVVPLVPMMEDVKDSLRVDLGHTPEEFLILYPGDLEFTDAAINTAKAAKRFLNKIPATMIMAMRPKTSKGAARLDTIRQILKDELTRGRVRIEGYVPYFQDLLSVSDLVLYPAPHTYAKTDIPLAILEGMSAGVPAIVGKGSALEELIDADVAVGCRPDDPDDIADTVIKLYSDTDRLKELRQGVVEYVKQFHTAEKMAEAFERLYFDVIKESGG